MADLIAKMIDDVMCCLNCGAKMGQCDCWERCSCGWFAEKGKPCRNPETTKCSTKLKFAGIARIVRRETEKGMLDAVRKKHPEKKP